MRFESRRHENNESSSRQILQNFKAKNPELIERIRSMRQTEANRTNISANYSTVSNSDEAVISIFLRNNNNVTTDDISNSDDMKTRETNADNFKKDVPYTKDESVTIVRSSNELLNAMIIADHHLSSGENEASNISPEFNSTTLRNNITNTPAYDNFLKVNNENSLESENVSLTANGTHDFQTEDEKANHLNEEFIDDADESLNSSLDIAEALTQVIDECEQDQSSSDMSVDEELMKETIDEINDNIVYGIESFENIVLTPPAAFRDI